MTSARTMDVAELIEGHKPGRLQISIIVWLCLLMVLEGYDMQVLAFAAPSIMKEWNVSRANFGWALSGNLFGYMLGALTLSVFGDRLGRKKLIVAGVALFGLFTIVAAFATSTPEMIVFRVLAGIGLGGAIPAGIALAAEYMPRRIRATAIGLMFVGYTLGAAFGGFLGAWTIADFGWPWVFYVGGLAALPLCLGLAFVLPESIRFLAMKPGMEANVAAIAARLRPDVDLSNVVRFTVNEETQRSSPLHLFTHKRAALTSLLWFAFITSFMGHYFLTGWLPTIFADAGLTISQASFASAFFQTGGALGSLLVALLLDRWGMKVVAVTFLLAAPLVTSLGVVSISGLALIPFVFMAGLFVLGGQIGLNAIAGTVYPTYIRTTGAGWALGIGRIGSISGPVIGGYLITAGFSRPVLFTLTALPLLCCAIAMTVLTIQTNRGTGRAAGDTTAPMGKAREFVH